MHVFVFAHLRESIVEMWKVTNYKLYLSHHFNVFVIKFTFTQTFDALILL